MAFRSTMDNFLFGFTALCIRPLSVSFLMLASVVVAFVHTIDLRVIKTAWKSTWVLGSLMVVGCACWECQLLEVQCGKMHQANQLCVVFLSLGLSPKPACWITCIVRGSSIATSAYRGSASPADLFPKGNLNGQSEIQHYQTLAFEISEGIAEAFL